MDAAVIYDRLGSPAVLLPGSVLFHGMSQPFCISEKLADSLKFIRNVKKEFLKRHLVIQDNGQAVFITLNDHGFTVHTLALPRLLVRKLLLTFTFAAVFVIIISLSIFQFKVITLQYLLQRTPRSWKNSRL